MPAISTVRLPSPILDRIVTYTALLPEARFVGSGGPYPVLYLLHPNGGDHEDWIVKTRLEEYVRELPVLVILPSIDNSLGCDMESGEPYERFFLDNLMAHVESTFAIQHGPAHTAIAGVAEGGYAALRFALSYSYWFGTAAALSGTVYANNEESVKELPNGVSLNTRYRSVFGMANDSRRKAWDLSRLAQTLPSEQMPSLFIECGHDDPLLAQNRDFHRRLTGLQVRHEYAESPGGHNWGYWDSRLPALLAFVAKSVEIVDKALV